MIELIQLNGGGSCYVHGIQLQESELRGWVLRQDTPMSRFHIVGQRQHRHVPLDPDGPIF